MRGREAIDKLIRIPRD